MEMILNEKLFQIKKRFKLKMKTTPNENESQIEKWSQFLKVS